MSHPVLSVCIFCLICATHSPCGSHAAVKHESPHIKKDLFLKDSNNSPSLTPEETLSRVKLKQEEGFVETFRNITNEVSSLNIKKLSLFKRNSINIENSDNTPNISKEKDYANKIFETFGDGNTMSKEGFEKFLESFGFVQIVSKQLESETNKEGGRENSTVPKENKKNNCIDRKEIFAELSGTDITDTDARINDTMLRNACPAILYTLMVGQCNEEQHDHSEESPHEHNTLAVWVYSTIAVILTSACGVLAVVVIPIMQMKFYKPLLQYLIALAASTLSGDAFLHLLPHAMTKFHVHGTHGHHVHHEEVFLEGNELDPHQENTWKGFVAMTGLMFLFFMERIILIIGKWRKGKQKKPDGHSHMKILSNGLDDMNESNPTQCVDRYNAYPYCYQDIINHQLHGCPLENDKTASSMLDDVDMTSDLSFKKSKSATTENIEDNQNIGGCMNENNLSSCTEVNKMLPEKTPKNDNITIILREHGSSHHGHSHSHGHVHSAPQNLSSVAWMVIMGDGLHNFTDGIAIGAAFSVSLAGGFSTTVAVFCHELPHELGDFAMLLKAGMTTKQALFYNLLSSVLSLFGNYVGILVGNSEYASSWVFAGAAGMFIYIALVDMLPELSSSHEDENNFTQYLLHMGGMLSGFAIMAVIALYEDELKSIFKEPM
ncbi:zinc transporter foi [Harmonia axyridis]|uniref:zinc transporter foi n=1 Tax=Harmonia axyridis TaxID=115357 RepID=UPI001E278477|nr:zinc transporter foi [Harmonia axyridis]